MPKSSRLVRGTVQPEVEPVEQTNTLALLPMAFLPAWMALEKIVVAAGTADSTLHGMPQICLFMAQGEAGRGCAASGLCWLLGSREWFPSHCSSLCLPLRTALPGQGVCVPLGRVEWMVWGRCCRQWPQIWNTRDAGHCWASDP